MFRHLGFLPPARRLPLLTFLVFCAAALVPLLAQVSKKRFFELPSESAERTLKLFSEQSGLGLVVNSDLLQGVRTLAVRGEFTPTEALDQMLAGTDLVATQDEKNGAFVVHRGKSDPNAASRPQQSPLGTDGPAAASGNKTAGPEKRETEEAIVLDAFKVSTTLGKYREVNSSTGTKTPIALKDMSGSLQVLNASFIADIRATSLEDLYPYVVGMNREGTTVAGFTMRGFTNSNPDITLNNVEVDGLPGLASRWGSPTAADVERVDILKGPSSVMYGMLNPGGMVNIVTKHPQRTAGASLFTAISSFAGTNAPLSSGNLSYQATVDTTGPIGAGQHFFYRLITSVDELSSFRGDGYFKNRYFFPSLTYRLSENTEVTAKIDVTRQTRNSDNGLVAPFSNPALIAPRNTIYQDQGPGDEEFDNGEVYTLTFRHHFANNWTASIGARSVQHRDGRSLFETNGLINPLVGGFPDVAHAGVIRRFRRILNYRKYNLIDANVSGTFGPPSFQHTILVGAATNNEVQDFRGLTNGPNSTAATSINVYNPDLTVPAFPIPGTGAANSVQRFYNYGLYASDQVKIGEHWRTNASVRYDKQDASYNEYVLHRHQAQSVNSTVPSVGLMYQPDETISLYGSYSVSFRPSQPIFVEASGRSGFPSEKAHQAEIGIKAEFPKYDLTATIGAYNIVKQNVTEAVAGVLLPNGLQTYKVSGEQKSQGIEAEVVYLPSPNWQVQLGYTYIDARVTASVIAVEINTPLFNVPHNDLSFWTRYNFKAGALRGFGAGLGEIYVGSRVGGYPTVTAVGTYRSGILPMSAYSRTNLAFYYQWRKVSLALNVSNVFDKNYLASIRNVFTVIPGEPRKLTLSAHVPF